MQEENDRDYVIKLQDELDDELYIALKVNHKWKILLGMVILYIDLHSQLQ